MYPTQIDGFLGKQLWIEQPQKGYRAGSDAVLLAAFVDATSGDRVVDLGSGVGTVSLCLSFRTGCHTTGLESHPFFHALAQKNTIRSALPFSSVLGDVTQVKTLFSGNQSDHVVCNPPYYSQHASVSPLHPLKAIAHRESTATLEDFILAASYLLKPSGRFWMIQRADRALDVLHCLTKANLFPLALKAVHSDLATPALSVLIVSAKTQKNPFKILQPLVLYANDGLPSTMAHAALRLGKPLLF